MMGIFRWKKKNSTEGQPVDGIVQTGEQTVLSLREKVWKFEVNPKTLKDYWQKNKVLVSAILSVIFVVCITVFSTRGNASVVNFYPTKCLGGWEHIENATGSPDVKEGSLPEDFTDKNSAILNKGISEMYCGGFEGETPKDISAGKFTVHFSWTVTDALHEEKSPSIDTIIDSVTPVVQEEEHPTSTEGTPSENPVTPTEDTTSAPVVPVEDIPAPESVSPAEDAPTGFLLIPRAQAQEASVEVSDKVKEEEVETIQKEEITPAIETNENSPDTKVDVSVDEKNDEVVPIPPPVDQGFLEALYSLDGATWKHLGYVNKQNWQGASFEIDESDLSWGTVPTIQVELKSIQTFDATPVIYLDSIWLSVSYEDREKEAVGLSADTKKLYVTNTTATSTVFSMHIVDDVDQGQELLFGATPNTNIKFYSATDSSFGFVVPVGTDQVVLPTYNLGVGEFIAVNTQRENACDTQTLLECMSGDDFVGAVHVTLASKIVPETPLVPEESLLPQGETTDSVSSNSVLESTPVETLLPNLPPLLNTPSVEQNSSQEAQDVLPPAVVPPTEDVVSPESTSPTEAIPKDDKVDVVQ
jgi:hypothetical protein